MSPRGSLGYRGSEVADKAECNAQRFGQQVLKHGFDVLSADELSARLLEPNTADAGSEPYLILDLDDCAALAPAARAALGVRLTHQSLPVIGWSQTAGSRESLAAELVALVDVLVHDTGQLQAVTNAIVRYPRASMVLVQVLRAGERLDIPSALAVESLGYATLLGGQEFASWLAAHDPRHSRSKVPDKPALRCDRQGDVLEVVLNYPENRNALSAAMRDGLADIFRLALIDDSIRQVKVRGEGPVFCAGGHLGEFGNQRDLAEGHFIRSVRMPAQYLAACRERVHFEVHGACIGAGIELSAFAAHITAIKGTFFRLPEIAMGLIPGAGGCVSIPCRIGRQRAAYMALTGADIDTEQALAWGLIDEIR